MRDGAAAGRLIALSSNRLKEVVVGALIVTSGLLGVARGESQEDELKNLKKSVESMQKTIDQLNQKLEELEKAQAQAPVAPSPAPVAGEMPASAVTHRPALNDEQEPAPRPDDLILQPQYRGFIPIANTGVMIRFNARPRTDSTYDTSNSGDDNRFIPAKIPVTGDPAAGGRPIANMSAKGTRLSIDVRAPGVDGRPRFYYLNDFFGSGSNEFNYRIRHLYGQIYNVIVGETSGVFEDPDIWPDTVDAKGPNSMILVRVPLVHYERRLAKQWVATVGVEQPDSSPDGADVVGVNHAPDAGFNVRWEKAQVGHVQFAAIFRDIGARSASLGEHEALGWGGNLSATFDLLSSDSLLAQATYGEGIGSLGNDTTTFDTDAAFDRHGKLVGVPYVGSFVGYTHQWSDTWRSTTTYGFVNLDTQSSQGPDAYRRTHYASLNLVWQLRERLSLGVETLYGRRETRNNATGDVVRTQVGMVYSIF